MRKAILRLSAAILACSAIGAGAGKIANLSGVRFYTTPQATTVTVELDSAVTPRKGSVGDPPRVFFDLPDTRVLIPGRGTHVIPVGDGVVSQIRVAQYSPTVARVVLELVHDCNVEVSVLANPVRLSFEVRPKLTESAEAALKKKPAPVEPSVPETKAESKPPAAAGKPSGPEPPQGQVVVANPPAADSARMKPAETPGSKGEKPPPEKKQNAAVKAPESKAVAKALHEPGVGSAPALKKPAPEPAASNEAKAKPPASETEPVEAKARKPTTEPAAEPASASKNRSHEVKPESAKSAAKPPANAPDVEPDEAKTKKPASESGAETAATTRKAVRETTPESAEAKAKPAATEPTPTAMARKPLPEPAPEPAGSEGSKPIAASRNSTGGRTLTRALGLKLGRVVIDAGHGGHDEGTRGPTGLLEKDLVLDVAQRLGALIEEQLGAEVVYTRTGNEFVPLEERTAIANRAEADLFLSLHANSSPYRSISGSEVYYLSFTTSKEALDVAARENASTGKSIHELEGLLKKIALSEKVTESSEFAGRIQRELYGTWNKLSGTTRNRGVKKAPFVVLIGANMPSVLAEIGFISNPHDESLLKKPEQRQRIAEALFRGVSAYAGTLSRMDTTAAAKQASR